MGAPAEGSAFTSTSSQQRKGSHFHPSSTKIFLFVLLTTVPAYLGLGLLTTKYNPLQLAKLAMGSTGALDQVPVAAVSAPISSESFLQGFGYRRSVYTLGNKSSVPDARIEEMVRAVAESAPSSYNSQSQRYVLLLGERSKNFWEQVTDIVKPLIIGAMGEEGWNFFSGRMAVFRGAYGSILFFEDNDTVKGMQEKHKAVAAVFPQWSEHASGMAQIALWTALELEGLGANLQHLNAFPPVEEAARKMFDLPASYSLKAQLVFGEETGPHPTRPEKLPTSQTVKVFA